MKKCVMCGGKGWASKKAKSFMGPKYPVECSRCHGTGWVEDKGAILRRPLEPKIVDSVVTYGAYEQPI